MTREHVRHALVVLWIAAAVLVSLVDTPSTAGAWLTWSVLGVALPVGLWVVTAPEAPTMSEAIRRGRD